MECEITEYAAAEDYFAGGAETDILFLDIELECPGRIYQVLPQLMELWGLNVQTDVEAKKTSPN